MALDAKMSKSALIRKGIEEIRRQKIIQAMQKSAIETRGLDEELKRDFDSTLMDGLEEEPLKGWVSNDIYQQAVNYIKSFKK
ncbi:MAG: hypothetical protein HAW58_01810 [Candidatus Thioglobus sp.]|nr:hypothetical protein [Candidatus Thioglobus sp.]